MKSGEPNNGKTEQSNNNHYTHSDDAAVKENVATKMKILTSCLSDIFSELIKQITDCC
jgi:hypothetical protein